LLLIVIIIKFFKALLLSGIEKHPCIIDL